MIARFAAVILACLSSASIAAAQAPVSSKPDLPARNTHADPLRGGWYPWDPYQYRDYRRGVPVLTGFDVEIERALERILGVLTGSFGGLMRDLLRHDRVVANLRGELYPEIAAVWGLAFAIFLEWEGERLQPEEIRLGVIVTILGVFLTRIVAIVRGAKGWSYV